MKKHITFSELKSIEEECKKYCNVVEIPLTDKDNIRKSEKKDNETISDEIRFSTESISVDEINLEDAKEIDISNRERKETGRNQVMSNIGFANMPYKMTSFSDLLTTEKPYAVYFVKVESNELLQVQMDVPHDIGLDYNLYVFKKENGNFKMVTGSQYKTDSLFMSEVAGIRNTTDSAVNYYIYIAPSQSGNGKIDEKAYFTVSISIGVTEDASEPAESIFFVRPVATLEDKSITVSDLEMHSPIDNDWLTINVPEDSDVSAIRILISAKNYGANELLPNDTSIIAENYKDMGNDTIKRMGSTSNHAIVPVHKGVNYFRIYNNSSSVFVPKKYNITFTPVLEAQKAYLVVGVDGYCQRESGLFNDRKVRPLMIRDSDIMIWVRYATENGLEAIADDTVRARIVNPNWNNTNMRVKEGMRTVEKQKQCIIHLEAPTTYNRRYDLVYVTVDSSKFGFLLDSEETALLDHYDDGETKRPCKHNGRCGLR